MDRLFSVPSCLICSRVLDEQKPLLLSTNNDSNNSNTQIIRDKLSQFKRSFHCFCKLLNINRSDVVDKIFDQEVNAYFEGFELSKDTVSNAAVGFPCCGECCTALDEVVRLQQAIDDLKASQMSYVEILKTSLLSVRDGNLDKDAWFQFRKQLIAYMLHRPLSFHSQPSSKSVLSSSRTVPNILRRKSKSSNILSDSGGRTSYGSSTASYPKRITSSLECILPDIAVSSVYVSRPEPSSSNQRRKRKCIEKPNKKSNEQQKCLKSKAEEERLIAAGVIRPCSVVLQRVQTQAPSQDPAGKCDDDDWMNFLEIQNEEEVPSKRLKTSNSTINYTATSVKHNGDSKLKPSTSGPDKKINYYNYGNLFYLVDENTLLCHFTLIKVSHGGTVFSCMEESCSTVFRNLNSSELFKSMEKHVEVKHMTKKKTTIGKIPDLRTCPFQFCSAAFPEVGRTKYRSHLCSEHNIELVVCEVCWKPIKHVADCYRYHKWFHKSKQEQLDSKEETPQQLLYRAKKQIERKRKKQLKKMVLGLIDAEIENSDGSLLEDQQTKEASAGKKIAQSCTAADITNQYSLRKRTTPPEKYKESTVIPKRESSLNCGDDKDDDNQLDYFDNVVDDFVPSSSDHDQYVDDDNDEDFIPEKCPPVKRSPTKEANSHSPVLVAGEQTDETSRKGARLNDKIYIINENILLYKTTLIQISHGNTRLTCLEPNCSTILENPGYSILFDDIKEHINSSHLPEKRHKLLEDPIESYTHCPISSCPSNCIQFKEGIKLRKHLFHVHSLEVVICEICLKPIRDLGDSYRRHKWRHRNDLEKMEVLPPMQVIYKARMSKKGSKSRKKLASLGISLDKTKYLEKAVAKEYPTNKTTSKVTKTEKLQNKSKPSKSYNKTNPRFKKFDGILKLEGNLLLYKYTLIRFIPGQGYFCEEPGCRAQITGTTQGSESLIDEIVKDHVDTHHAKMSGYASLSRQCPICDNKDNIFKHGINFMRHFLSKDAGGHGSTTEYLCQTCWKPMKTKLTVRYHLSSHKSEEEKAACDTSICVRPPKPRCNAVCSTCGRRFNTVFLLRAHEAVHLPKELRKRWDCPHCPDKFLSPVAVRNHVERRHRPDLIRYRYCPICNRRYNYRSGTQFYQHIRSHKEEKSFVCETCGGGFCSSSSLATHIKFVHTEVRIYQCEYCEINYKHRGNLKRHLRTAHKDKVVDEMSYEERLKLTEYRFRPDFIGPKIAYPCQFCDKIFQLKSRMTKHVKLSHAYVKVE